MADMETFIKVHKHRYHTHDTKSRSKTCTSKSIEKQTKRVKDR